MAGACPCGPAAGGRDTQSATANRCRRGMLDLQATSRYSLAVMKLVTKSTYARRRCQWCRKQFTPAAGGRPAVFCSATCRQRDYEARKGLRTRPDARLRPESSRAPRHGRLFVTSQNRPIFNPEDAKAMFLGVQPHEQTDFAKVALDLDFIVLNFFSAFLRRTAATAGEDQKRLLGIASGARQLLAAFGVNGPRNHLDNGETVNSFYMLAIPADTAPARWDLYLRHHMAEEISAPEMPSEWHATRATLRGLQMILVRAECAATIIGTDKGAPRKPATEELFLVGALHALYADVTGDKRWITTSVDNGKTDGPFVRFVMAVAKHIHDNLDALKPAASTDLAENLKALSTSPRRIGTRIRLSGRTKGANRSRLGERIVP